MQCLYVVEVEASQAMNWLVPHAFVVARLVAKVAEMKNLLEPCAHVEVEMPAAVAEASHAANLLALCMHPGEAVLTVVVALASQVTS